MKLAFLNDSTDKYNAYPLTYIVLDRNLSCTSKIRL